MQITIVPGAVFQNLPGPVPGAAPRQVPGPAPGIPVFAPLDEALFKTITVNFTGALISRVVQELYRENLVINWGNPAADVQPAAPRPLTMATIVNCVRQVAQSKDVDMISPGPNLANADAPVAMALQGPLRTLMPPGPAPMVAAPVAAAAPAAVPAIPINMQLYHDLLSISQGHRAVSPLSKTIVMQKMADFQAGGFLDDTLMVSIKKILTSFVLSSELPRPNGLLLHGPPGTGKTTIASWLLQQVGFRPLWLGTAPELSGQYVGETEKDIIAIFDEAKRTPHLRCALFIDEIDTLTARRSSDQAAHRNDWLSLMLRLVGSQDYDNVFVIGGTNRKHAIDEAFLRAGRMEHHLFCGRLPEAMRVRLFLKQCAGRFTLPVAAPVAMGGAAPAVAPGIPTSRRVLLNGRTGLVQAETPAGLASVSFSNIFDQHVTIADILHQLLNKVSVDYVVRLGVDKFKDWSERDVAEVFEQAKEEIQLYMMRNDTRGVALVVELDEIVGLSTQLSTASVSGARSNVSFTVEGRDKSESKTLVNSCLRPHVMERVVTTIDSLRQAGRVLFLVVSQVDELLSMFAKRANFGPTVSAGGFQLDVNRMPPSITVVDGRTARVTTAATGSVVGNTCWFSGRHYFEAELVKCGNTPSICIGLVRDSRVDNARTFSITANILANAVSQTSDFMTLHCGEGNLKISCHGITNFKPCGALVEGSCLGVLLDLTEPDSGFVVMYLNGECLGVVFSGLWTGLNKGFYPVICMQTLGDAVRINPKATPPAFCPEVDASHGLFNNTDVAWISSNGLTARHSYASGYWSCVAISKGLLPVGHPLGAAEHCIEFRVNEINSNLCVMLGFVGSAYIGAGANVNDRTLLSSYVGVHRHRHFGSYTPPTSDVPPISGLGWGVYLHSGKVYCTAPGGDAVGPVMPALQQTMNGTRIRMILNLNGPQPQVRVAVKHANAPVAALFVEVLGLTHPNSVIQFGPNVPAGARILHPAVCLYTYGEAVSFRYVAANPVNYLTD